LQRPALRFAGGDRGRIRAGLPRGGAGAGSPAGGAYRPALTRRYAVGHRVDHSSTPGSLKSGLRRRTCVSSWLRTWAAIETGTLGVW